MTRLGREYAAQGKITIFEALKPFMDPINNKVSLSYEQVANELQVSVGAVKTLIHRLRKRYSALLREEVGRTVTIRVKSMEKSMLSVKLWSQQRAG